MAEQPFLVGNKARELLRYTQRATRIVSDDISRSDARKVFQKAAALEDIREMKQVCTTAVHALDVREKEGFTKSTFNLYGRDIRETAKKILLDAHAANNVNFATEYDKRIEKIGEVVDSCSLLLEYLTLCTEDGIISAKKAGIWTKKITDVKYPAMKWLKSERGRAESLRQEAEKKRLEMLAKALQVVFAKQEQNRKLFCNRGAVCILTLPNGGCDLRTPTTATTSGLSSLMAPTTTGTTTTPMVFAPLRLICETSRRLPKAVQQPKETASHRLPMQASDKHIPLRWAIPAGMQPTTATANQRRVKFDIRRTVQLRDALQCVPRSPKRKAQ